MQGARVASAVAHDLHDTVVACIFLSYPLHPPGKQVHTFLQSFKDWLWGADGVTCLS